MNDPAPGDLIAHGFRAGLQEYLREHGTEDAFEVQFAGEADEETDAMVAAVQDAMPTMNQLFIAPAGHEHPLRPWARHLLERMAQEALAELVEAGHLQIEDDEA